MDESGNSGNNLTDANQPIFVLGALMVPDKSWQPLEQDLEESLARHFPTLAESAAEIHAGDLRGSRGPFKGVAVPERVAFRDAWLEVALNHRLKFVYRSIEKKRFQRWLHGEFGGGVLINPPIAAFPFVATALNRYLTELKELGMLISDENKEIMREIKSNPQLTIRSRSAQTLANH